LPWPTCLRAAQAGLLRALTDPSRPAAAGASLLHKAGVFGSENCADGRFA